MEQLIVINVDPEKMKDYHRGDVCDIDFGYDGKVERHKVRIVSKYRLRNGESRVKLVSFQHSVYTDAGDFAASTSLSNASAETTSQSENKPAQRG